MMDINNLLLIVALNEDEYRWFPRTTNLFLEVILTIAALPLICSTDNFRLYSGSVKLILN